MTYISNNIIGINIRCVIIVTYLSNMNEYYSTFFQ